MSHPRKKGHVCALPVKDTTGLAKLPPNASFLQKLLRNMRKLFLLNPNNYKCKKLFRNKASLLTERRRHASGPNSLVFHPLSILSSYIDGLFCITWLYCLITDPIMVYTNDFSPAFRFIQTKVVFSCQLIVITYFFNAGYVETKTKQCIVQRRKIICRYLRTFFLIDIAGTYLPITIATFLTQLGLLECSLAYADENYCYGILFFIKIFCCGLRTWKLFRTIDDTMANMGIQKLVRIALIYFMRTFIWLNMLSFLLYFMSYMKYHGKWPEESWLHQSKVSHTEEIHNQFSETLLMTICFFFAINQAFYVTLTEEQAGLALITIFGRIYTLYLLADVLNIFGLAGISESMYERQLLALQRYMREKDLPKPLRQRMLRYYEYKFQKRYFRESMILSTLSEHLRTEIFLYTARKLVQKVQFFKKLPKATMGAMIAAMKVEIFSSGDIIIKVGEQSEMIYFISNGTVAVTNKDGLELCHLEDGEEFGSTCMITQRQLYAEVAVETTEVFSINKEVFLSFVQRHEEVLNVFYRSIKQKLKRYQDFEQHICKSGRNIIDELPDIIERRTRRFISF